MLVIGHRARPAASTTGDGGQRGSSLIFVLAFILLISVILTGLLAFAFTANRSVDTYRRDRALHFAADSALEVAVQVVKLNPRKGESVTPAPDCSMLLPLSGMGDAHDPAEVFANGANLEVSCTATANVSLSGTLDPATGQQYQRDVTFTVVCRLPGSIATTDPLACGSGSNEVVLGIARVRYEIDPGYTPTSEWARVPKVISWDIKR